MNKEDAVLLKMQENLNQFIVKKDLKYLAKLSMLLELCFEHNLIDLTLKGKDLESIKKLSATR